MTHPAFIVLFTILGLVCIVAAFVGLIAASDDYLKAWQAGFGFAAFLLFTFAAIGCWAYAGALYRA